MGIVRTKQQKRRAMKAAAKRLVSILIIGILIVASMYVYNYLTTSDSFAINEVEFRGLYRLDPAEIEDLVADLGGQNILLAPLDLYEDRIEMHPRIRRVTMNRVLPDKITCVIDEREPVALVFADRLLEVDRAGMVMAEDEFSSILDLPVITGLVESEVEIGKINSNPGLHNALYILGLCKDLGGEFAEDVSELRVSGRGVSIRSLTKDRVLLLGDSDYKNRLRKYFLLEDTLSKQEPAAQLIDLRFDDQVVLRGHK